MKIYAILFVTFCVVNAKFDVLLPTYTNYLKAGYGYCISFVQECSLPHSTLNDCPDKFCFDKFYKIALETGDLASKDECFKNASLSVDKFIVWANSIKEQKEPLNIDKMLMSLKELLQSEFELESFYHQNWKPYCSEMKKYQETRKNYSKEIINMIIDMSLGKIKYEDFEWFLKEE